MKMSVDFSTEDPSLMGADETGDGIDAETSALGGSDDSVRT